MNVDEARVPNDDPDWSIEIFLFSNGQKYSPPRKYYLRADDLNLWEATLENLATLHYGLQCPRISLFTTDGQLVEGPLGLNGGQAYVAVAEPDRFIDAGYQKYLMKASRSWEKRQARKKVTECVPGDPCCLCPEKEWCCDPQTCCKCLEKEDLHSQELLAPVSEHLDLRPLDEHYMSSTSTKPVPRGDYGLRSVGIGPITDEHEVRSGEYETSPAQYGYSPVPAPAKPEQYGAGISVNGANLVEQQAPKLSGNRPRPGEYKIRSDEYGTKPYENTGRPGEYEVNLTDHAATFNESGAEPEEYGAKKNEHGSRLSQNGEKPVEYVSTLSENEPRLSKDVVQPGAYGARPGRPAKNVPKPADYETRPSRNGIKPDEYEARPGAYKPKAVGKGATPDKHEAKLGEYEIRLNSNEARPGEYGARPGEYKSRPSLNGAKPRGYVPRASEYKPRSNANGDKHETRPSVNRDQPGEYGTKPGEYAAKPSEYETTPNVNGVRPGEHEARPGEYETRTSINGVRSGEHEAKPGEHETKPSINGVRPDEHEAKPGEHETRSSINGVRPGEYKARPGEHETRPSINEVRPGEHEARPGEHETRPSINGVRPDEHEAKPGEHETRSSINGVRPGEYKARPGEHETRPSIHKVMPGEREAGPGEHEIIPSLNGVRPGEHDASPDEHETRQSVNGVRPGENAARPVEHVTRPSINGVRPREHEARPGEHEFRPSVNRVRPGEHEARLGEHETRPSVNRVRPGEHEAKPGEHETRPSVNRVRPGEHETRPGEHETRPSVNGVWPGEHEARPGEHETRPSINRAKPGDSGARPGKNEVWSGEDVVRPNVYGSRAEIEHTRRISGKRGIQIQQGGRKGEVTRDFEHGGTVSEQKRRDSNLAGRAGGQRARESGATLSEQRNKQSDLLPRFDGRESKLANLEARPGDYGLRSIDHDTSLENAASRVTEPSSGTTASVSRPSPRARINSRVRTSDLGQLKSRTPTRVDETAARLDDSGIKNTVGHPGARPGSVGGTAVGEALYISEAPQQARRSSLFAGRPSTEKKRLPIGQNSSLLKKPTLISSVLRKLEDKEPKNTKQEILTEKTNEKAGVVLAPASNDVVISKVLPECFPIKSAPSDLALPTIGPSPSLSLTTNKAPLENTIDETYIPMVPKLAFHIKEPESEINTFMRLNSVKHFVDVIDIPSKETQTEIIYVGKSMVSVSNYVEAETNTETVDTKQHAQDESASKKAKVNSDTFQTSAEAFETKQHAQEESASQKVKKDSDTFQTNTKAVDTKQHAQDESASKKEKVDSDTFQSNTEAVDTKQHAQEESASNKAKVDSDTFQSNTEAVDTKQHAQEESASNKAKVDSDTFQSNTEAVDTKQHAQEDSASNKAKVDSDTFKTNKETDNTKQPVQEESTSNKAKVDPDTFQYSTEPVNTKLHAQEESLTNKAKVDSDTFQYRAEPVDTKQHAPEDAAINKVKVDSDTRCLCSQRNHKLATGDLDENTKPIVYQGDEGTINLKLEIKIRNVVKSVYSCQNNCQGVRSTNIMTSEKESQISIVDNFLLCRDSLNSLFYKNSSRGYGFDFSPNVMVVQCAGCGRLNNQPGCDPPQCCDNNKKYFVLLTNSVNEDMDESCNCNAPCRPSALRQTQSIRQSSIIPVKKSHSEMNLDTITTVTVSGVPLQNREMKKCNLKTSSCQTEETHECVISKHKVSITEESVTTPTSEIQKKSSCSSSFSLTAKRSRLKIVQEIYPEMNEHEGSLVCWQTDPVPCQKVPSACIKASSHTSPRVQSMECQQTCPPVQTQGCSSVSSTCPSCYPMPLACIQIQTHVCPHGPQVSNMETQTQWKSLVLQARLHSDGRYSFHLPPLNVLNNFPF